MTARLFTAGLLTGLWFAGAGWVLRYLLLDMWRFDILVGSHWIYLQRGLTAAWDSGAGVRWDFLAVSRRPRVISAGEDGWRVERPVRVPIGGGAPAPAVETDDEPVPELPEPDEVVLSAGANGRPVKPDRPTRSSGLTYGEPMPQASNEPTDGADPEPSADGFLDELLADTAVESSATGGDGPEPSAAPRSLSTSTPMEGAAETLPYAGTETASEIADVRAAVVGWLRRQGWSVFPDLYVNADGSDEGWPEAGDWFDADPFAVIDVFAACPDEIRLIVLADLGGLDWRAVPWDPERQGIASWRTEDGLDMPCPVTLGMRARKRFLDHHGAYLTSMGVFDSTAQVGLTVILADGGVVNWEEAAPGWDRTDIDVVPALPGEDMAVDEVILARVFGSAASEALDPFLVQRLKEESRAAAEILEEEAA